MSEIYSVKGSVYRVSIVIPTLGGETLASTIEHLNHGSIVPAEIVVCVPEEYSFRLEGMPFSNVKIVKTQCRGQVAQRSVGFQHVQYPLVMQLDDDVLLKEDTLQNLANELLRVGRGNALSPVYNYTVTGHCVHELGEGIVGWLKSLYAYVICGAPWGIKRMGVVTLSGVNYGVDCKYSGYDLFETQWLPGGCMLYYKDDLIKECFYPFVGKAYCEDIIHSFLLKKKGLKLWVVPKAICTISLTQEEWNWSSIKSDYKARRYFVQLSGGSLWRLRICHIGLVVSIFLLKCFKYIKEKSLLKYVKHYGWGK